MVNVKDSIIGKKYGRLTVIKQIEDKIYKCGRRRDQIAKEMLEDKQ